ADLHGKYDLVLDGRTIEHIFDQAALFRNIHSMLKVGGRVIHMSPSTNHMDHGFYMYSPTLFHDYYSANKYKILTSYLIQYDMSRGDPTFPIFAYKPQCLPETVMFDARQRWLVYFVAMKTPESPGNAIPQQGCSVHTPSPELDSPRLHPKASHGGMVRELI